MKYLIDLTKKGRIIETPVQMTCSIVLLFEELTEARPLDN